MSNTDLIVYEDWDDSAIAEEQAKVGAQSGRGLVIRPNDGSNFFQFAPPLRKFEMKLPWLVVMEHSIFANSKGGIDFAFDVLDDDDITVISFACPAQYGEHCPVCERSNELRMAPRKSKQNDLGFEISTRLKCYANVLDPEAPELGWKILQFTNKVREDLINIYNGGRKKVNFTDPTAGWVINIIRENKNNRVNYSAKLEPEPDGAEITNEMLGACHDLRQLIEMPSEQALENFLAVIDATEERLSSTKRRSKAADSTPRRARGERRSKAPEVVEPEVVDEDDDGFEEVEPTPAPRRRKKRRLQDEIEG